MPEPPTVESGDSLHEGCGGPAYVWIAGVCHQHLAVHLVIVQLDVKSALDSGDCASRPNIKIVGADTDDLQVVRLEKVLNCLGFRRRGRKPGSDVGTLQPVAISWMIWGCKDCWPAHPARRDCAGSTRCLPRWSGTDRPRPDSWRKQHMRGCCWG